MSERHITILTCDRCGDQFDRQEKFVTETRTCKFGVFVLRNGSGSRMTESGRGELDKDLCVPCTDGLLAYLHGGKASADEDGAR